MRILKPETTFLMGEVLTVNGQYYRAKRETKNPPFRLRQENGEYVTHRVMLLDKTGKLKEHIVYVMEDDTLNDEDWELFVVLESQEFKEL